MESIIENYVGLKIFAFIFFLATWNPKINTSFLCPKLSSQDSSPILVSRHHKEKKSNKAGILIQPENIKVAAIALATVDGMVDVNYQRALRLTEIAAQQHPDIILLPEAFAAGYSANDLTSFAETQETSKYLQEFRHRSLQYDCMIVMGYLEKSPGGVRNAAVIFDRGKIVGVHYKSSLWADNKRPYRDEQRLLLPGKGVEVIPTRFGRVGLLICYENMVTNNWDSLKGKVDLVVSPYNCEGDPSQHNIRGSRKIGVPSVWADRVGTVYCGEGCYTSNPGSAGMVDESGKVLFKSVVGVEKIIIGTIKVQVK